MLPGLFDEDLCVFHSEILNQIIVEADEPMNHRMMSDLLVKERNIAVLWLVDYD